jgi:hypothetical protein
MPTTFSTTASHDAVRTAAAKVGVNAEEIDDLRADLHLLPADDVVAEVAPALEDLSELSRTITLANWLNSAGLPAAEPLAVDQPLPAAGLPVAFWRRSPRGPARIEDLAAVLRRLHALPVPADLALPEHDVLGRLRPAIENAPIGEGDRAILLSRLGELRDRVDQLDFPLEPGAIHGNAHLGAVASGDAGPTLVDLAHLAHGQPEWDLAAIATEHRTAGWWTTEQYRSFADTYGFDITEWHGLPALEAVHQIRMTAGLMPHVQDDADKAAEYESRMRTVRDGLPSAWTPRADSA